ncbi:zinc finger protein 583-like [Callorhinchus milii]|uniref:zinc finger protein 583-like n=1 Tax=Callorhinchus milii TaxID=7868 RepID=UPI001C3F6392|nr:zinc finger protein 583-like [Callorhinchus milii]
MLQRLIGICQTLSRRGKSFSLCQMLKRGLRLGLGLSPVRHYTLDLRGIYPPITTPFNPLGQLQYQQLVDNVHRWSQLPFRGLVVQGSNGEYPFLTETERVEVVNRVRQVVPADKLVVAGSGCECKYRAHCPRLQHCVCGFLRASDLVVHKRFHTKERPFRCSQCHRAFYQSGDLRRHVRNIHMTNARMVTCHHCHKKYSNEATLLHHIQAVHQDPQLRPAEGEIQQHTSEVVLCESESAAGEADVMGADQVCGTSEPPARVEANSEDILLEEVPATVFASETYPLPAQTEVYLQPLGAVSVPHSAAHS